MEVPASHARPIFPRDMRYRRIFATAPLARSSVVAGQNRNTRIPEPRIRAEERAGSVFEAPAAWAAHASAGGQGSRVREAPRIFAGRRLRRDRLESHGQARA